MVLLSQMMRTVAITGSTETINGWLYGRQGGRWAEQTVRAAFPANDPRRRPVAPARTAAARPAPADPAELLAKLTALHERGDLTDAEYERLRGGLPG